jgi:hypothetical protein
MISNCVRTVIRIRETRRFAASAARANSRHRSRTFLSCSHHSSHYSPFFLACCSRSSACPSHSESSKPFSRASSSCFKLSLPDSYSVSSGTYTFIFLISSGDYSPDYSPVPKETIMITKPPQALARLKAQNGTGPKSAHLQGFLSRPLGQCWPGHWPAQPGPSVREPGAVWSAPVPNLGPPSSLGSPLNIGEVARLIGCSPWTVRQTLIPRGLPHFRFKASGRLTFYERQVVRWIESQQQGGKTTK